METNSKPTKRNKKKIKKVRNFKCILCERLVIAPKDIIVRKNYSHGKKSKSQKSYIHRCDGGCMVELRKKNAHKV